MTRIGLEDFVVIVVILNGFLLVLGLVVALSRVYENKG